MCRRNRYTRSRKTSACPSEYSPLWLDIEVTATAMACIVVLTLPGSLRAQNSVAVLETLLNVSPRPLHSLSKDLCHSEYSLQSSQTSSSGGTAAETSPAPVPQRAVSIAKGRPLPPRLTSTAPCASERQSCTQCNWPRLSYTRGALQVLALLRSKLLYVFVCCSQLLSYIEWLSLC